MTKDVKNERRASFSTDMGAAEYYRRTLGLEESRSSGRISPDSNDSCPSMRVSKEIMRAPPPTPASSAAPSAHLGSLTPAVSGNMIEGPAETMADMPARQFVAVLVDILHQLRENDDYIAMRLLLADIGKQCEKRLVGTAGHDMVYAVINDLLAEAMAKYGPDEGDTKPPGPLKRFWSWCMGGRCANG